MRSTRLRRTVDIARVRSHGIARTDRLFVMHALPTISGELRIAVSASRALGTAVARNRTRRRIREAIRVALRERGTARSADLLVVARPAARDVPAAILRATVERELQAVLG